MGNDNKNSPAPTTTSTGSTTTTNMDNADITSLDPVQDGVRAVFAYGTLRGDCSATGDQWGVMEKRDCGWRRARVRGFRLYQDAGKFYPFVVPVPDEEKQDIKDDTTVLGTVMLSDVHFGGETRDSADVVTEVFQKLLADCDYIEGYDATNPGCGLYNRTIVEAELLPEELLPSVDHFTQKSPANKPPKQTVKAVIYFQTAISPTATFFPGGDWLNVDHDPGDHPPVEEDQDSPAEDPSAASSPGSRSPAARSPKSPGARNKRTVPVFCYGSNGIEQLRERCENASLAARPAVLEGYERIFAGFSSRWEGGVASVVPAQPAARVLGSVVELTQTELEKLDVFEDVDSERPESREGMYRRVPVVVRTWARMTGVVLPSTGGAEKQDVFPAGREEQAVVYVKNDLEWVQKPSERYLRACASNIGQFWPHGDREGAGKVVIRVCKGEDADLVEEWGADDSIISPPFLHQIQSLRKE